MSVLPSIGYDHPDQSHFTSRHFWEVGATDPRLLTGWLGRYLDASGSVDNPLQGLSMTGSLQPSLATSKVPVAAIDGPDQYDFWAPGVWGDVQNRMLDAIGGLGHAKQHDPAHAHRRERDRPVRQAAPPARTVRRAEARRAAPSRIRPATMRSRPACRARRR